VLPPAEVVSPPPAVVLLVLAVLVDVDPPAPPAPPVALSSELPHATTSKTTGARKAV
jgi:hypothetical protein